MRFPATAILILWSLTGLCQQAPSPTIPSAKVEISGTLPAVLKVKVREAAMDRVSLAQSAKRPTYVAPSAIAYGHSEFSTLGADLSFYAGLTERGNTGPQTKLDTLEVRFDKGPRATMVLDITRDGALVGRSLAKKLGILSEKDGEVDLPPFDLGTATLSGARAQVVPDGDLPSDAVDGVLPLGTFSGLGVHWEPSAGRITLYETGATAGPSSHEGAFPVAARCQGGALLLQAVLQGRVQGYFLLNPAQPHSAIDDAAAREAQVPMKPTGDVGKNQLVKGGLAEEAALRIGKAQIGIRSARVVDLAAVLPEGCLGILGRETFELFNYYVEPGACTVVFVPVRREARSGR